MTTKKKNTRKAAKPTPVKTKGDSLAIDQKENKSSERLHAEMGLSPITGNMFVANLYANGTVGQFDLTETNAGYDVGSKKGTGWRPIGY